MAGYHLNKIVKGTLGESSKIREELEELEDAEKQNCKIMISIELSDMYGALELYAERLGLTMNDLKTMSKITRRVFESGERG